MLIVSGGKVPPCSASGKLGPLCCCARLRAIQGPAMCSRVTEAGQAAPAASAVAAAVCPPSVMAEMCAGLLLNSMPLPSHTWASRRPLAHTHKQSHAENHTPLSPKEKEAPTRSLGSRVSNAAECTISPSSYMHNRWMRRVCRLLGMSTFLVI